MTVVICVYDNFWLFFDWKVRFNLYKTLKERIRDKIFKIFDKKLSYIFITKLTNCHKSIIL